MEFFRRSGADTSRLSIFPGTFNPPTRAHLALAEAALDATEEVLFVLPRTFPHKTYVGASFEDRLRMLEAMARNRPRFSIGSTTRGLFIDIARAARPVYPPGTRLYLLCGGDAARRILHWDYGQPGAIDSMLEEFELLVADRGEPFEPPARLRSRIHPLALDPGYRGVSATEVRERIARGLDWKHLVPEEVAALVPDIAGLGPAAH